MTKFTKESFDVVSVTDIPKSSLLPGVLKELNGREMMTDTEFDQDEKLYSGDVFEAMASELAEMDKDYILYPSQDVVDQINNLAEILETELVRIVSV
jgi:hypothetical protein